MATESRPDRREAIIAAAYSCMARGGYERTSTAQICAAAGVSSGTFFHYFPTKAAVLVAILEAGLEETRQSLEEIRPLASRDARAAIERWCDHVLEEASDEDLAGFDAVLGAVPDDPGVVAALQAETHLVREFLTDLLTAGQEQGVVRTDATAERLATWLSIVANGVLGHAFEAGSRSTGELRPELLDVVDRFVRP
ncbi:TetR/AcrR family transcriptional regulator [Salana multivorans]